MATVDVSAAFDMVNEGLLLKRQKILGLLSDVVGEGSFCRTFRTNSWELNISVTKFFGPMF